MNFETPFQKNNETDNAAQEPAIELGGPDQAEINAKLGVKGALENARPFFARLIAQLKEPFESGTYSSILGDDVTGRLPALVLGEVACRIADERNLPRPARLFFAGGSAGIPTTLQASKLALQLQEENLEYSPSGKRIVRLPDQEQREEFRDTQFEEHFTRIASQLGKRVLLVTDHIWQGRTVDRLARILYTQGVEFDVATLGTNGELQPLIEERAERPEFTGVTWYSGGDESQNGVLYGRQDTLKHNKLRDQVGTEKDYLNPVAKRSPGFDAAKVRTAREYIASFSEALYEESASPEGEGAPR